MFIGLYTLEKFWPGSICLTNVKNVSQLSSFCLYILYFHVGIAKYSLCFGNCNWNRAIVHAKIPRLGSDLRGLGHVPIPQPNILARDLEYISEAGE